MEKNIIAGFFKMISFLVLIFVASLAHGQVNTNHHHEMGQMDVHMHDMQNACTTCLKLAKEHPKLYASKLKIINLEASQFKFKPAVITIKKGDIVRLVITSKDVMHGVYIKDYKINVPVKKGEKKVVEFVADKAGKFTILCSVYCGSGHHKMKAVLIVK